MDVDEWRLSDTIKDALSRFSVPCLVLFAIDAARLSEKTQDVSVNVLCDEAQADKNAAHITKHKILLILIFVYFDFPQRYIFRKNQNGHL